MSRRRPEPSRLLAGAFVLGMAAAHAQQDDATVRSSGLRVQPRISVMETWTDNLRLSDSSKDQALITVLSPGINISSYGGSLRGSLDYSLNGIAYLKTDVPSRVQNALTANGQAELISNTFFVDANASIGQQNASAFGLQSAPSLGTGGTTNVSTQFNPNQHETGTLMVSPLLRGSLGSLADYELRGNFTRTEARGTSLGDSHGRGGSLRVSGQNPGLLGWWLQAMTQKTYSATTQPYGLSALTAGLTWRPDPDWSVSVNAGRERNDYRGGGAQQGTTAGVGAQWTPTPRTRIGADWQRHSYGNSHSLSFEHRMARSVWRLADTQAVTLGTGGTASGVSTLYDQLFLMYASSEPDPVKRDVIVRTYLQAVGLSPDMPVAIGFLSSGPIQLRSQTAGVTLQGVRSTISAQVVRSITSRLGAGLNEGDLANFARIEQRSYSLIASHQLTPLTSASLTASRQETSADLGARRAYLTSLVANWNARLGVRLNLTLGARHSRYNSDANSGVTHYTENAAYANLTQQF